MRQGSLTVGKRVKLNRGIAPSGIAMSPGTIVKVDQLAKKGFRTSYKGRTVFIEASEVDPT